MTKIHLQHFLVLVVILGMLSACAPAADAPTDLPTTEPTAPPIEIPTQTLEPIHLKVGDLLNYVSYAPLFIAYEEGYFTEQGLDVELIDFGSQSSEFIPALLNKQLDIAPYPFSAAIFNPILSGVNVVYVADKGFLNPESCVTDAWVGSQVSLDNGSLTDVASLEGKNVVSIPGGVIEYSLDVMLAQAGLTQADIVINAVNDSVARVDALGSGSVDLSILSEPWITRAAAQNAGSVWMPLAEIIPNFSMGAMVFGPSIMEGDPEIGVRFMVAYLKAIQQFNEGKTNRNIEIIALYTQLTPEEISASCMTSFKPDARIDPDSMMDFMEWTVEKGYVDALLTIDQILNNYFVEEAFLRLTP